MIVKEYLIEQGVDYSGSSSSVKGQQRQDRSWIELMEGRSQFQHLEQPEKSKKHLRFVMWDIFFYV